MTRALFIVIMLWMIVTLSGCDDDMIWFDVGDHSVAQVQTVYTSIG
jgi:hypothetical protein